MEFPFWKGKDLGTLHLPLMPIQRGNLPFQLTDFPAKVVGQAQMGQNMMKAEVLFTCTGGSSSESCSDIPLLIHFANKQARKKGKDTDLTHTTDTTAAASFWAGGASPPCFLLECCIPTWGWGHICRDTTSQQAKAMKQELKPLCTHSPDLSLNSYWGGQARTRKSDRFNLACHTKGKMDFGLQV